MNEPLVTSLIPTYRRPKLLKRAIKSILRNQSVPICVQVLDNCSEDETCSVVSAFQQHDNRVKYFRHSENIGAVANFVSALDFVKTPYFSLLSDDDIVMPQFYEKACECLDGEPNVMFVLLKCLYVDESLHVKSILSKNIKFGINYPPEGFWEMFKFGPRTWTAIVFRSSILENNRPEVSFSGCFDMDFLFRLAAKYPYAAINHVGAAYVCRTDSYSGTSSNVVNDIGGRLMLYKRISNLSDIPADIGKKTIYCLRRGYRRRLLRIGMDQLLKVDRKNLAKTIDTLGKHGNNYTSSMLRLLMICYPWSFPFIQFWKTKEKLKGVRHLTNPRELKIWENELKNYASEL